MDRNGFVAVVFIFVFFSSTCDGSLGFHIRKLIAGGPNNGSITPQVSPTGSPVNESNANPINAGKSQEDKQRQSQKGNQDNNSNSETLPIDSKGPKENENSKSSVAPSPPADEKNATAVDKGVGKAASTPDLESNGSCEGSLTSCKAQEMLACIQSSKRGGSKELFLVVKNEGKSTLKVNVNSPSNLKYDVPALEVPKHKTRTMNISSIVGKSTELTVNSGNAKCVLQLVNPVSVDKLIQQLSFYSKRVSPIYAVYGSFLLAFLLGGTWACCKLRKRNQPDGVPYQELEMGLPESTQAANVDDAAEGWDHDWDDDWDEDNAVKSPGGNQIRSISADGLTSRPNKKDGWDDDWED